MDRYWFLTNTCYGNWLPGDSRGFVGRVWEHRRGETDEKRRVEHAEPGAPYDQDIPKLAQASRALMKGTPIHLTVRHAEVFLEQVIETTAFRGWELRAISIMFNHFHIVVGVSGDPDPAKVLGDLKSWSTRALTRHFGAPEAKTWWTQGGSKRKVANERALAAIIHYVLFEQTNPLITWSPETGLHYGPPA